MAKTIDLSQLPAPDAVSVPDFEVLLTERKQKLVSLYPQEQQASVAAALDLLSEPQVKVLEESAYREILTHQRINEAVSAVLLASSGGNDLTNLSGNYDVGRRVVSPGDPSAIPPVLPTYESDEELRQRTQLSWGRLSTAGAAEAYRYFGSEEEDVLDVQPYGPETHGLEGRIFLYVLSRSGDGTAPQALLDKVLLAVSDDEVRPLTDFVSVHSATVVPYTVEADIQIPYGLDGDVVIQAAQNALLAYNRSLRQFDRTVSRSGIDGALHQPGVITVTLKSPAADMKMKMGEVPWCTGITLNRMVVDYE